MTRSSASGKIILSGEYAMAFGYPGIAVPSKEMMRVSFAPGHEGLAVIWGEDVLHPEWAMYSGQIVDCIERQTGKRIEGELTVETDLPLGKGMGSSTALVIAISKALLGEGCKDIALAVEAEMNPGHSGMDFAVIWAGKPVLFRKGVVEPVKLPDGLLANAKFIDSGMPSERTPELVAWVREREAELKEELKTIGTCTERILAGEDFKSVMRHHHKAQVTLGVVPKPAQDIIAEVEAKGGAAKVIGAGGRTGGGGMVMVIR